MGPVLVVIMDKQACRGDLIFWSHSSPVCHVFILLMMMANRRWLVTAEFHCQMRRWSSFIFVKWLVWGFCYKEHRRLHYDDEDIIPFMSLPRSKEGSSYCTREADKSLAL